MSHNDFLRRGGIAGIPNELVPSPQDFQRLDVAQFENINGDDGGSCAPATPVVVGGAANPAVALSTVGSLLSGGAKTTLGGRIVLGANDLPIVSPPRTRKVIVPLWELEHPNWPPTALDKRHTLQQALDSFGLYVDNSFHEIAIPRKYIHSGAQLTGYTLRFRIPKLPSSAEMPNASGLAALGVTQANTGTPSTGYPNNATFYLGTWAASTVFNVGQYVTPTPAKRTGYYYKCFSTSGTHTSGVTEPNWPTTVGATIVDNAGANQIFWRCVGRSGQFTAKQTTDPATLWAGGGVQSLSWDPDPTLTNANAVDGTANFYELSFQIGPSALIHSLELDYGSIGSLAFE